MKEILQERLDLYKVEIDENELNLRRNIILGGVFYFDMLQIPPQPKRIANWIILFFSFPFQLRRFGACSTSSRLKTRKEKLCCSWPLTRTSRKKRPTAQQKVSEMVRRKKTVKVINLKHMECRAQKSDALLSY